MSSSLPGPRSADDASGDAAADAARGTRPSQEVPAGPDERARLGDVVDRGTVRRAPRYRAFFTVGVLLGLVVGLGIAGAWLGSRAADPVLKPGVYVTVIVLGTTTLTTLLAGLAAVLADRRSLRRR